MYRYSQVHEADKEIEKDLDKIREAISGKEFTALYLYGAYGKGEGGFVNGEPVNDYDILLVGGSKSLAKNIQRVETSIEVEVFHVESLDGIKCTQQWFEIKYGSQLLFGRPIELPEWQPYEIEYADAIESLNKRTLSMLVAKHEMMKDEPDLFKIVTQISKMIIALGDAVLIKRGQFNPSYRTRLLMLQLDGIRGFYEIAVNHKLFGETELNKDEIWGMWNEIRKMYREYILVNQIKTEYSDMLINFDERVSKEALAGLLEALGAKRWL